MSQFACIDDKTDQRRGSTMLKVGDGFGKPPLFAYTLEECGHSILRKGYDEAACLGHLIQLTQPQTAACPRPCPCSVRSATTRSVYAGPPAWRGIHRSIAPSYAKVCPKHSTGSSFCDFKRSIKHPFFSSVHLRNVWPKVTLPLLL